MGQESGTGQLGPLLRVSQSWSQDISQLHSHLQYLQERALIPSSLRLTELIFLWLYDWGHCFSASCQPGIALNNQRPYTVPCHLAVSIHSSNHGSLLLQSQQETLSCFKSPLSRRSSSFQGLTWLGKAHPT